MKHLKHALVMAALVVLAQAPAIIASPSVQHYIEQHPWIAVYVPIVSGLLAAAYKALKEPRPAK